MRISKKELKFLADLAEDDKLLEIGRKAIEDMLVDMRDDRLSFGLNRGNGLVIRERDGQPSNIIRLGPEMALQVGLKAIVKEYGKRSA